MSVTSDTDPYDIVYTNTLKLLNEQPDYLEHLKAILNYIDNKQNDYWEWADVRIPPQTISKMIKYGVVSKVGRRLRVLANKEAVRKAIEDYEIKMYRAISESMHEEQQIPSDLFSVIIGYEDLKEILIASIQANFMGYPTHIMLEGVAGSGKSIFLMELERLPNAVFTTGETLSKAGLRETLIEAQPRFLIIDEIDKLTNPKDLNILMTFMASQRLKVDMYSTKVDMKFNTNVYAAANDLSVIERKLPALIDRFRPIFYLKEYTDEEFIDVAVNVLTKQEKIEQTLARHIALRTLEVLKTKSIRQCINIARLTRVSKNPYEFVDKIIKTVMERQKQKF